MPNDDSRKRDLAFAKALERSAAADDKLADSYANHAVVMTANGETKKAAQARTRAMEARRRATRDRKRAATVRDALEAE